LENKWSRDAEKEYNCDVCEYKCVSQWFFFLNFGENKLRWGNVLCSLNCEGGVWTDGERSNACTVHRSTNDEQIGFLAEMLREDSLLNEKPIIQSFVIENIWKFSWWRFKKRNTFLRRY
jgi:hypothetical protein